LVAQCQQVTDTDFSTNFWPVGAAVIYPLNTSSLQMRVTSILADSTGTKFTIGWSYSFPTTGGKLPAYTTGAPITNPALIGLVPNSGSVIMAETQYTYNSPINVVIKKPLVFPSTFFLSPRQTTTIPKSSTCFT
jgi:hypothetical protein